MKKEPATITLLKKQLTNLKSCSSSQHLSFNEQKLIQLVSCLTNDDYTEVDYCDKITSSKTFTPEHAQLGWEAFNNNEVALCTFAGGCGSRLNLKTKGLVKLSNGLTTLAMKLTQSSISGWGKNFTPELWIMTSESTSHKLIQDYLSCLSGNYSFKLFKQFENYALNPMNELVYDINQKPIMKPSGTGDLGFALKAHRMLEGFIEKGGKYIIVSNVDNILGNPDPTILGYHIASKKDLTCEVVVRNKNDVGGGPMWADGRLRIIEDFCLPEDIKPESCKFLNTNNIIINAEVLLHSLSQNFKFHKIRKNHNGKLLTYYERLIHQLGDWYDLGVIEVPRELRYLPIKTKNDINFASDFILRKK